MPPALTNWSYSVVLVTGTLLLAPAVVAAQSPEPAPLRPPAVPLATHDPYFSIWSPHDELAGGDTLHWTGAAHRLTALVRIAGETFRLMGAEPADIPALRQRSLTVTPTQTKYTFGHERATVEVSFLTPALPDDLAVLARPVTYITLACRPRGGDRPDVQFYFDAGAEIAVNVPAQQVRCEVVPHEALHVLRSGTLDQPILEKQGDDLRIDWGYLYVAARRHQEARTALGAMAELRGAFVSGGDVPAEHDAAVEGAAADDLALALSWDLGAVSGGSASRTVLLAYDDLRSLRYFDEQLLPYWRTDIDDAAELLDRAAADHAPLAERCRAFDEQLLADAERVGGPRYAQLVALCHRQSLAGTKLVADGRGQPLFFTKENNSNGCIGTVDVFYPQAPHLLLLSPALMKATLVPMLDYAASPRWPFDFAPHDLGRYPHATGQVYGGGERTLDRQMMVEESANMLLLLAAVARVDGNAEFSRPYWQLLERWAAYLEEHGYDPENQLCTDDFAGHLAHNVNLSAKAICALGAYARLARMAGKPDAAEHYHTLAWQWAQRWPIDADDENTHTRLGFASEGTWSQKYNLVWDRVLGLELFDPAVVEREIDYYRTVSNRYGLPLDSRSTYTKLDWILWTASLATDRADFDALVDPVVRFVNETPDRTPLTDWYFTDTGLRRGFKARPVIGGVFMPMLTDGDVWRRWATAGANVTGPWAPLPLRPRQAIVPTGEEEPAIWRVNFNRPRAANWAGPDFDPPGIWQEVALPLGVESDAGTPIRTPWDRRGVWARREFTLDELPDGGLHVRLTHTGPVEVRINGVLALARDSAVRGYQMFTISAEATEALRTGRNVLAVHTNAPGPRPRFRDVIDVGLVSLRELPVDAPATRQRD